MLGTSKTIDPGQSFPLKAIPKINDGSPGSINGPVTWSSSDPSIAIVIPGADQFNVSVKGLATGNANIMASAQAIPFGPNIQSTFSVSVTGAIALPPFTHFDFDFGDAA